MQQLLREELGVPLMVPDNPQTVGALASLVLSVDFY
jgi:hypothetical protein